MEAMRQSWTDDRLDDLRDDLNEFRAETKTEFGAVQDEFAALRKEMATEFTAVRKEMTGEFAAVRREMRDEFKAIRQEMKDGFDGIQKLMIRFMAIMVVALCGIIASIVGAAATVLL